MDLDVKQLPQSILRCTYYADMNSLYRIIGVARLQRLGQSLEGLGTEVPQRGPTSKDRAPMWCGSKTPQDELYAGENLLTDMYHVFERLKISLELSMTVHVCLRTQCSLPPPPPIPRLELDLASIGESRDPVGRLGR